MRNSRLSTVIFVVLLALLLYALYVVLGGDISFLRNLRGSGTGNLLEPITNGLSALGRGITDVFTSILP